MNPVCCIRNYTVGMDCRPPVQALDSRVQSIGSSERRETADVPILSTENIQCTTINFFPWGF